MKLKIILLIGLVFLIVGIGLISSEIIKLKCDEEDPLKKLDIRIKYLTGQMNPMSLGIQPFSKEGGQIATFFNNFKKECVDKWYT